MSGKLHEGVCIIPMKGIFWPGAVFFFFFPLSSGVVLMDNDKNVFVSVPAGSGEMGIGVALVCETEL